MVGTIVVTVGAEAMMPSLPSVAVPVTPRDSLQQDTAMVDTLLEVTVMGDSLRVAPVKSAIDQSLKRNTPPSVPSLGDVLNKVAPGAMDHILHPFGFAERKKKKKLKKQSKILQQFDQADQKDEYNRRLDSIMRIEGLK